MMLCSGKVALWPRIERGHLGEKPKGDGFIGCSEPARFRHDPWAPLAGITRRASHSGIHYYPTASERGYPGKKS